MSQSSSPYDPLSALTTRLLAAGERFADRYAIHQVVGRGLSSVVYLAEDTYLERTVALKVSQYSLHAEAKIVASLDQEGIPTLYDAGTVVEHEPTRSEPLVYSYLTRFSVPGTTLLELLRSHHTAGTAIKDQDILCLGMNLCQILHVIHQQQMVVHALHPGNIVLDEHQNAWLIDLGSIRPDSRWSEENDPLPVEAEPPFCAPEAWLKGHFLAQGDLYSLGVLLHMMDTGIPAQPCHCRTVPCHCGSYPLFPLSSPLGTLITQMVHPAWKERPASALAVEHDLLHLFAQRQREAQQ